MGVERATLLQAMWDAHRSMLGHPPAPMPEERQDSRKLYGVLLDSVLRTVPRRCEYCDGTGDVHRADGEWLGECDCPESANVSLREALTQIEKLGSDGEHSGDRHARCREIARAALAKAEGRS